MTFSRPIQSSAELVMIGTLIAGLLLATSQSADSGYLYKAVLLRASPGSLLEVIDTYRDRRSYHEAVGDHPPFIMRHSQGDHWDLMVIFPMGSFARYYQRERVTRRERVARETAHTLGAFDGKARRHVAWREEVFVAGPPLEEVAAAFGGGEFYHVEMFIVLPGKYADLKREREMENAYLAALDRPENLIFERVAGAAWDLFTIGVYRDIKHFSDSADIPADRREAAAKAAGFDSADEIGTYLRTLMDSHHDTLARAVRE